MMQNEVFVVQPNKINNYRIVCLEKEITFENNSEFNLRIMELEKKELFIALNMKKVDYIDSSTIGIFIKVYRKLKEKEGELVFFNMTEKVINIFEGNNLSEIFKIYDSEEEFEVETMNIDEM